MKKLSLLSHAACLLLAAALTCCSSSGKKQSKNENGPRLAERLGKWDTTKRSSFDTHRSASGVKKDYKTGLFHRKKDPSFKKEFNSGKGDFKTKEFAQSNKESSVAKKTFSGADDKNRMADKQFKTSESRFASQQSRDGNKRSSMEDDVYRTREDPVARKAMSSNKRPYIEELKKPGYTEDEVKGILNKL